MDLFQGSSQDISECSQETFFLELVFVGVGISGLQTFNIRVTGVATQWVLFKYPFLCDH